MNVAAWPDDAKRMDGRLTCERSKEMRRAMAQPNKGTRCCTSFRCEARGTSTVEMAGPGPRGAGANWTAPAAFDDLVRAALHASCIAHRLSDSYRYNGVVR